MLKLGTENISGLYVGEQKIKKAFVGEQLVFEDNPTYTVYFYAVDEEDSSKVLNSSSFTVNPGESVSVNPWDINGYNFAGWYDESGNLVSSGSSFSVTPTGDATYYLKYYEYYTLLVSASGFVSSELVVTINGEDYTITRNADAQGNGAELHLRKNSVITVKIKTIPSGYKFDNWGLVYANVTSTADPYAFTLARDLEILHGYLSKASRVPAGYTELEYLANNPSIAYSNLSTCPVINVPLPTVALNTVEITFMVTGNPASSLTSIDAKGYAPLFGYTNGNSTQIRGAGLYFKGMDVCFGNGIYILKSGNLTAPLHWTMTQNTKYTMRAKIDEGITYNGTSLSTTRWYGNATFKRTSSLIWMSFFNAAIYTASGGLSYASYAKTPVNVRIYGFNMLDADGNYIMQLIPCKNPSGVLGFYNTVDRTFYRNTRGVVANNSAITSTFTDVSTYPLIAGPAV